MFHSERANVPEKARLVRALNESDSAEVGGNFVVKSSASLLGSIVRLSEDSDIASVRISVGDDNEHEVSKVPIEVSVREICLEYDVEPLSSHGEMQ